MYSSTSYRAWERSTSSFLKKKKKTAESVHGTLAEFSHVHCIISQKTNLQTLGCLNLTNKIWWVSYEKYFMLRSGLQQHQNFTCESCESSCITVLGSIMLESISVICSGLCWHGKSKSLIKIFRSVIVRGWISTIRAVINR